MAVSVKMGVPHWVFTTKWHTGFCRLDGCECEYQSQFTASYSANGFPDVSHLESLFGTIAADSPTTCEELFERLANDVAFDCFKMRVSCRSERHGILTVGHE